MISEKVDYSEMGEIPVGGEKLESYVKKIITGRKRMRRINLTHVRSFNIVYSGREGILN